MKRPIVAFLIIVLITAGFFYLTDKPGVPVLIISTGETVRITNGPPLRTGDEIVVMKVTSSLYTSPREVSWYFVEKKEIKIVVKNETILKQSENVKYMYYDAIVK